MITATDLIEFHNYWKEFRKLTISIRAQIFLSNILLLVPVSLFLLFMMILSWYVHKQICSMELSYSLNHDMKHYLMIFSTSKSASASIAIAQKNFQRSIFCIWRHGKSRWRMINNSRITKERGIWSTANLRCRLDHKIAFSYL